ncbi:DUF1702 family protein [Micromonospora sp. NPDC049374]|uniref:DUF1702 family protein n=1 Tax=Micromonospora sp. NPDC049374 TaxID=3154352 RepID=UPI0034310AA1
MPSALRLIRRRVLMPDHSETTLAKRGFPPKDVASKELLETIGRTFLTGFGHALDARAPREVEHPLEQVTPGYRGFAYEGAAMALAVLDGIGPGRPTRVRRFLRGRAERHSYMVHVGVGWALARLPRWRRHRVLPDDPLLRWLTLDGYGFHQAYFHTDRYVRAQHRDPAHHWPSWTRQPYTFRAIDQGIGRAIWFVEGTDPRRVVDTIERFPAARHPDLFSGAGLAATYAGGADRAELEWFGQRAGRHRAAVAQAAAFAAQARVRAGLVTPHTHLATAVLCGTGPVEAASLTDRALVGLPPDGPDPAFEVWRSRIADAFVTQGRQQ